MSGPRRRKPLRLMGRLGRMVCYRQRADLAIVVLQWVPIGDARAMPVVGIGATCTDAQMMAFGLVGTLSTSARPGLS